MAPRLRHTLLAALVAASVAVPVADAAQASAIPAPAPDLTPVAAATPAALAGRYAASRADILSAADMAAGLGGQRRAGALRAMAEPDRQFLSFDGRDGGRSAEVVGDLAAAGRIAVLVPGSDTSFEVYRRLRNGAVALHQEAGAGTAVVAWLGYATPATVSAQVLTPALGTEAAGGLRAFVNELHALRPDARISLLCHSYGTVVCASAVGGLPVSDLVLFGSPGTGAEKVAELRTDARVWAGRGADDWIANVPHLRLPLPFGTLGLGADPVSPEFGARAFAAGDGGHSDYLRPGSVSLASIARIVTAPDA